jgi:hypothetical protein
VSPRVRVRKRLGPSAYAPGIAQKASIFGALLLLPPRISIVHFFFAPNPATSRMAGIALRLHRRPSVQTVSSSPASYEGVARLCFGDRVVALSEYNRKRLADAGVRNVVKIHPGIDLSRPIDNPEGAARWREKLGAEGRRVLLYAGDYEFSQGARIALDIPGAEKCGRDVSPCAATPSGPVEARIVGRDALRAWPRTCAS